MLWLKGQATLPLLGLALRCSATRASAWKARLSLLLPPCLATDFGFPGHLRLTLAMEPAVSGMAFESITSSNEAQDDPTLKPSPVSARALSADHSS